MAQPELLPLFNATDNFNDSKIIHVPLKDKSYDIAISKGIIQQINIVWKKLKLTSQALIITHKSVFDLYGDLLLKGFSLSGITPVLHFVPEGEAYKNINELQKIFDVLVEKKFYRDSTIIAFGGGVIGDLAGFAAASYMRGINLVQIPTTLLAQVDSSVGGKTAVNHPKGKNLIGAFYQPRQVLIDPMVLSTLPDREIRTGLAEIIKYGVIDDEELFVFLEKNNKDLQFFNDNAYDKWEYIISRSCGIKAKVVSIDERESGLRAILNFGHTIGHALEAVTEYMRYNHGEAVAIGMVGAAIMGRNRGYIGQDIVDRIVSLTRALGLPTDFADLTEDSIINALKLDKKIKEGKMRFVLPQRIGFVEVFSDISVTEIENALREMKADEATNN